MERFRSLLRLDTEVRVKDSATSDAQNVSRLFAVSQSRLCG